MEPTGADGLPVEEVDSLADPARALHAGELVVEGVHVDLECEGVCRLAVSIAPLGEALLQLQVLLHRQVPGLHLIDCDSAEWMARRHRCGGEWQGGGRRGEEGKRGTHC